MIHRDIKSENCFITGNNSLKLGDLGEAKKLSRKNIKEMAGTLCYSSPEQIGMKSYNQSSDIWSLGF